MKKRIKICLILLVALICCIAAGCGGKAQRLPVPENLKINEKVLSWNAVENAKGYVVTIDGEEHECKEAQYSLADLDSTKVYEVKVYAVGDGKKYNDSYRVKFTYVPEEEKKPEEEPKKPSAGLKYNLLEDGSGYEVSGQSARGNVVIPATYNGLPVTKLAKDAFDKSSFAGIVDNTAVTGIELPSTITEIGEHAFRHCVNLQTVNLPAGVIKIGGNAFDGCANLKTVDIPESVVEIGGSAFYRSGIQKITLPKGVTRLENSLFSWCTELAEIEILGEIEYIGSRAFGSAGIGQPAWIMNHPKGYITLQKFLLGYSGTPENGVLDNFPQGVEYIVDYAFSCHRGIESVVLPENVQIGKSVFNACTSLKQVVIPTGVTQILEATFQNTALESVVIPEGVTEIKERAFAECESLKSVTLPSTLQKIGMYAFKESGLESVTIPKGVTSLSSSTFGECNNLEYVVYLPTTKDFSLIPFYNCQSLKSIYYGGGHEEWEQNVSQQTKNSLAKKEITVYFYVEEEANIPADGGNYWHYAPDGKTPVIWNKETEE